MPTNSIANKKFIFSLSLSLALLLCACVTTIVRMCVYAFTCLLLLLFFAFISGHIFFNYFVLLLLFMYNCTCVLFICLSVNCFQFLLRLRNEKISDVVANGEFLRLSHLLCKLCSSVSIRQIRDFNFSLSKSAAIGVRNPSTMESQFQFHRCKYA